MLVRERVMAPRTSPRASHYNTTGTVVEVSAPRELHARVFAALLLAELDNMLAAPSRKPRKNCASVRMRDRADTVASGVGPRLFPSHEQAEWWAQSRDTRAMFEERRWRGTRPHDHARGHVRRRYDDVRESLERRQGEPDDEDDQGKATTHGCRS
jgi:hypothetical protein